MTLLTEDTDALAHWLENSRRRWRRRWWWLLVLYWLLFAINIAGWLPEVLFVHFSFKEAVFEWIYRQPVIDFLIAMTVGASFAPALVIGYGLVCGMLELPAGLRRQDWLIAYGPAEVSRRYEAWVRRSLGWCTRGGYALFVAVTCMHIAGLFFQNISFNFTLLYLLMRLCALGLLSEVALALHLRTGRTTGVVLTAVLGLVLLAIVPELPLALNHYLWQASGEVRPWLNYNTVAGTSAILLMMMYLVSRANQRGFEKIARG